MVKTKTSEQNFWLESGTSLLLDSEANGKKRKRLIAIYVVVVY